MRDGIDEKLEVLWAGTFQSLIREGEECGLHCWVQDQEMRRPRWTRRHPDEVARLRTRRGMT